MKNNYPFLCLCVILMLNCTCSQPDITPAFLVLSVEDFKDCIDVSDYNRVHETNYDQKELATIKQQNFTDVLVSLNGKELGYWSLPCRIPLLPNYNDRNNIRIIPCVRTPNTVITTIQYHFITPIDQFFEMEREKEYRFPDLKLEYVPSVDFLVLETFTQSTDFSPRDKNEFPAAMEIIYDEDLKQDIGRILLSDSSSVFFDVVTPYMPLQGEGKRYFWEFSYKIINGRITTHLSFENTISGIINQDLMLFSSTQGGWRKAYIDITEWIMQASNVASQVSTRLRITGTRTNASIDSYYCFENIKLISMDAPYY